MNTPALTRRRLIVGACGAAAAAWLPEDLLAAAGDQSVGSWRLRVAAARNLELREAGGGRYAVPQHPCPSAGETVRNEKAVGIYLSSPTVTRFVVLLRVENTAAGANTLDFDLGRVHLGLADGSRLAPDGIPGAKPLRTLLQVGESTRWSLGLLAEGTVTQTSRLKEKGAPVLALRQTCGKGESCSLTLSAKGSRLVAILFSVPPGAQPTELEWPRAAPLSLTPAAAGARESEDAEPSPPH